MRNVTSSHKFLLYAIVKSIRHPRQPIVYTYCPDCKIRIAGNSDKCPNCGKKTGNSPGVKNESPVPWWGSAIIITLGIAVCIVGAWQQLSALDRIGDALVMFPLGNLYGMSRLKD